MKKKINYLPFLLIFIIVLVDFLTKSFFKGKNIEIIHNIFHITYSKNPGLIFGLFANNIFFNIILPILVIILIGYYWYKKEISEIGSVLIIAGILGNLIDRILYGYVTDWIFFMIYPKYNISLFNLSDASLVIGIIISIYYLSKKN